MNNPLSSIAHLKLFALGLAVVALGFFGSTAAFAQQPERDDFFTEEQEYSEEEYLRELEELEELYNEYLAEESKNEVAIFPEDGQFGRNVPDPIKGQSPEIFITSEEQEILAETILTEQPTPEVELAEEEAAEEKLEAELVEEILSAPVAEEAAAEEKSEIELVEEILLLPVTEEAAAKPAQEIVEAEETGIEETAPEIESVKTVVEEPAPEAPVETAAPVLEEPIVEEAVVETVPVGEEGVVEIVEEVLQAPATETSAIESPVVEEVVIEESVAEAASEPVQETVETPSPEPAVEVVEETEALPEPERIIVEVPSPEPEVEIVEETEAAPAPTVEVVEETEVLPEPERIIVEVPSPEPAVEVVEETEVAPAPTTEVAEETEAAVEEEVEIAIEEPGTEEPVETADADSPSLTTPSDMPFEIVPAPKPLIIPEGTPVFRQIAADGETVEETAAEESETTEIAVEDSVPATSDEPVETVAEVAPAEEEPAPSSFVEQIEAVVEGSPTEEFAPAEPVETVAETAPAEESAPAEPVETVAETAPAEESAPTSFFGQIIQAVTEIVPVEQFSLEAIINRVETVAETEPAEEPALVASVDQPAETVGEIIPIEQPVSEEIEIEVAEESPVARRGPFAVVVEEPAGEAAGTSAQQTAIGSSFANLVTTTTGFAQSAEPAGSSGQTDAAEPVANVDELSLFEQVAVLNLEETDYASQDMFASIAAEDTSEKPQTGDLEDLALFQAPPEQGSFDPYPDSTIEAPGETLLAMGEVFTAADSESYPSSAGEFGKYDPAPDPNNPPKGIFGGKKGISLFNTNPTDSTSVDTVTGLSVNSFLWRATLDTLSFMPLASADPFGGVVITDWHNNPQAPNERFKVVAYILDKDLRVGALRVSVFRQEQSTAGIWTDAVTDENVHIQLETTILSRARELRTLWLNQQEGG